MKNVASHVYHRNFIEKLHAPLKRGMKQKRSKSDNEDPNVQSNQSIRQLGFVTIVCPFDSDIHEKKV